MGAARDPHLPARVVRFRQLEDEGLGPSTAPWNRQDQACGRNYLVLVCMFLSRLQLDRDQGERGGTLCYARLLLLAKCGDRTMVGPLRRFCGETWLSGATRIYVFQILIFCSDRGNHHRATLLNLVRFECSCPLEWKCAVIANTTDLLPENSKRSNNCL